MTYEDDPAVIQARANLTVVERVQQEKAEQKRLEREEQRARAEAERLKGEIEEVERKWRELEEAELRRLAQERDRLEAEKRIEEQRGVQLCGAERAVEQRRVALVALSPPEAGPSRAPPGQPKRSARGVDHKPGIVIPEKNCTWCIARQTLCLWKPARHAWRCQLCQQLKKPCRRFEEMVAEGKWRAEGKRGSRKRPRVVAEEMEKWNSRSQKYWTPKLTNAANADFST